MIDSKSKWKNNLYRFFVKIFNTREPKEIEGHYYIILEHLQNNLMEIKANYGSSSHMTEQIFFRILSDCVEALKRMKKIGIAHLDIKPQNIVCDNFDQIKMIDFGTSERFFKVDERIDLIILGTPVRKNLFTFLKLYRKKLVSNK